MSRRPNRPRRAVAPGTLRVLRLLGWRYSANREAWVHRLRGGRRGPVFVERRPEGEAKATTADPALLAAMEPTIAPKAPAEPSAPLPRRTVRCQLHPDGPASVVVVEGRPPRLRA